jgi:hypothetical protein
MKNATATKFRVHDYSFRLKKLADGILAIESTDGCFGGWVGRVFDMEDGSYVATADIVCGASRTSYDSPMKAAIMLLKDLI